MNNQEFYALLCDRNVSVRSYSGRGMFGKQCIAVSFDAGASPYGFVAELVACLETDEEREGVARIFAGTKRDSLGMGFVLYWENMVWDSETMQEYSSED